MLKLIERYANGSRKRGTYPVITLNYTGRMRLNVIYGAVLVLILTQF